MATEEKDKKGREEKDSKNRRIVRDPASGKSFYLAEDGQLTEIDPEMDRLTDVLASKVCDEMERRQSGGGSDELKKRKGTGEQGGSGKSSSLAEKLGLKK